MVIQINHWYIENMTIVNIEKDAINNIMQVFFVMLLNINNLLKNLNILYK